MLGVTADIRGDFADADSSYARAQELAPDQPELLNNIGWSYLLRGEWAGAIAPLKRAAELMPGSPRIANNLQLAIAALSENLPARGERESEVAWAARLNDAGVAAQIRGQHKRAVAAFAQALEARGSWYERAANNLRSVEAKQ